MQVIQPFFKTLHTLNTPPGWLKGYDFIRVQLGNFGKHQQPTSLCIVLLYFESSSKETSILATFGVETWKTYPRVAASSTSQNCNRGGQRKVRLPSFKSRTCKKHINIVHHTD